MQRRTALAIAAAAVAGPLLAVGGLALAAAPPDQPATPAGPDSQIEQPHGLVPAGQSDDLSPSADEPESTVGSNASNTDDDDDLGDDDGVEVEDEDDD